MKKIIPLLLLNALVTLGVAQGKYMTKTGEVTFFSSAPLEDIEAVNQKVQSVIDMDTKTVVISMLINNFVFDKRLMQEHFNENYMESEKYPKSIFKGSFESDDDLTKPGTYEVKVSGEMTIHGVTNPVNTLGYITVDEKGVKAETKFDIKIADYDVKIPRMVFKNIAEVVEVTAILEYAPLNN